MTVVIGTAGHIDHGKTTLLRALTGIDADRLPEERRRGMTIDVGYAHMRLDDGTELDFVDVPGHDRLVGNMLVGAGEIDAAMLVVAADDGPRAQTLEHLALLDALGIDIGLAVVTKADTVDADRVVQVAAEVARLLDGTTLAGANVLIASGVSGDGLGMVRDELARMRDRVLDRIHVAPPRPATLATDRLFSVKGRGNVVTGTLRGGVVGRGATLRLEPGGQSVRVREVQVHGEPVVAAGPGRAALNLVGVGGAMLHRGMVLTADPEVVASSRLAVTLRRPSGGRVRGRLHLGTAAVDATADSTGRDALDLPSGSCAATLRLAAPVAARVGDRFVMRTGGSPGPIGGIVLDAAPPVGISRRRRSLDRLVAFASAVERGDRDAIAAARLDLHGVIAAGGGVSLAGDVEVAAVEAAFQTVLAADRDPTLPAVRSAVARALRRVATATWTDALTAAGSVIDELVEAGRLVRDGDRLRGPGRSVPADPALAAAMDRLEERLAASAPPPLAMAADQVGCPDEGIRALERAERIVILEPDLAYATSAYERIMEQALAMATRAPLTPAAFRDATGTSRKYVLAILEDLDRRQVLRRTPVGHVPGPRARVGAAGR